MPVLEVVGLVLLTVAAPSAKGAGQNLVAVASACNFTVDAGTGQGFNKGVLRGGTYFLAVTPATDPTGSA